MKPLFYPTVCILLCACTIYLVSCQDDRSQANHQTIATQDTVQVLKNARLALSVNLYGGAFTDIHLSANPINPLTWKVKPSQMPPNNLNGAVFQGHFLCLGRWGSPSEGEMVAGVPHNGEPTNSWWKMNDRSETILSMHADAPKDGLSIKRTITLDLERPFFKVTETATNTFSLGRVSNIVQHPTLGPPFLDEATRINTNAGDGFLQKLSYPDPHRFAYRWPEGIQDEARTPLDLRRTDNGINYVSTHIFDPETTWGWITAYSPTHNLVYGFIWETEDYPWLNVWQHFQDGKPYAKGLEFGTTGIGRPYKDLLEADTRFNGYNSWEYIDAGESIRKSYWCFLVEVDEGFGDVKDVKWENDGLVVVGETEEKAVF